MKKLILALVAVSGFIAVSSETVFADDCTVSPQGPVGKRSQGQISSKRDSGDKSSDSTHK